MTEGPEATYLASYIARRFKQKRLKNIKILDGRYKHHGPPTGLSRFKHDLPIRLLDVQKRGKVLFLVFEKGWYLIAKMGMTGWFTIPKDELLFESDPNMVFQFEHTDLEYHDFRNFGTLTFTQDVGLVEKEYSRIAPDILDSETTFSQLQTRIQSFSEDRRFQAPLDLALMDQTFLLSGIGNIIKSELLYDAKLSPKRPASSLSKEEWRSLFHSARKISKKVLNHLLKEDDRYFESRAVYQRVTDPQGRTVQKYKSRDGRTTFWVPEVQK